MGTVLRACCSLEMTTKDFRRRTLPFASAPGDAVVRSRLQPWQAPIESTPAADADHGFTHECLALRVAPRLDSHDVLNVRECMRITSTGS